MSYSKFSLKTVKEKFGITLVEDQSLFDLSQIPSVTISPYLELTLAEGTSIALAINTEKSRSEWIIAPILTEVRKQVHAQISLFSGRSFTVDRKRGLYGQCDYLLSLSPEQLYIAAPAIAIVEAKKEDIVAGLGQCIATMYAVWLFNERENRPLPWVYGVVTTGTTWKFLKLRDRTVYIDRDEYYFKENELPRRKRTGYQNQKRVSCSSLCNFRYSLPWFLTYLAIIPSSPCFPTVLAK